MVAKFLMRKVVAEGRRAMWEKYQRRGYLVRAYCMLRYVNSFKFILS
jgi:hypothetical protein